MNWVILKILCPPTDLLMAGGFHRSVIEGSKLLLFDTVDIGKCFEPFRSNILPWDLLVHVAFLTKITLSNVVPTMPLSSDRPSFRCCTKTLYVCCFCPMHATCPNHPILLHLMILTLFISEIKSWRSWYWDCHRWIILVFFYLVAFKNRNILHSVTLKNKSLKFFCPSFF
jgi:hypothetical protein